MLTVWISEGRAGSESPRVEATTWQREPTVIRLSRLAAVTRKRHVGIVVVAKMTMARFPSGDLGAGRRAGNRG